ncbi:putative mRNA 3 -end-processing protein yth-1 [Rosellinia necatrix]|uniref:mRNA 3'-end-processing protein n=1 Tax=Rosellinia necatrix TaxID=77044 RepID=A0A1S7UM80_ROSNE|nr:putative mRNA 3 -end-processing protein yth-1 [Rosellinia necatrix]
MADTLALGPPAARDLAQQILDHRAPSYTFSFSPFLRNTYGHGYPPNRPACKPYLAGHCPAGAQCPDRHAATASSSSPSSGGAGAGAGGGGGGGGGNPGAGGGNNASYNSLVCKHWLRALCKKGEGCEFLHEYNLRKMPECNFFVRNGYCSNGDECLYLHIDPLSKLPPCPHYDRGFCPLGPNCSKRHVRRKLCLYYLAGFCPEGKACREGTHARWEDNLERPVPKSEVVREEPRGRPDDGGDDEMGGFGGGGGGGGGGRRDRDDKFAGGGGRGGDRFGGGRGGRWRGRGDRKFRGRGHH